MILKPPFRLDADFEWDVLIENSVNKTASYKLTIIVPVYYEEDNIYRLAESLLEFISQSEVFPSYRESDYSKPNTIGGVIILSQKRT